MSKFIILLFLAPSILSCLTHKELSTRPEYESGTNTTLLPNSTTSIPTTSPPVVDTTTKTIVRTKTHSVILGNNRFTVRIRPQKCNRACTRMVVKHIPLKCPSPPTKCLMRTVQDDSVYNMCVTMIVLLTFMIFLQCTTCFIPFLLRILCQRRLSNRPNA